MSELVITDLEGGPGETKILRGLSLTIRSGEVHALMGPNGSGKSTLSHVLLGRPGYHATSGTATLDGIDLLALPTWQRAQAGLFLGLQYPTEVPGVPVAAMLGASIRAANKSKVDVASTMEIEADRIGFDRKFLARPLNVGLSGGEKKRNETMQLAVLAPKMAVLDEIDSGLDVDALRAVSRRVLQAAKENGVGVLAITHYQRLLAELTPDVVHVFVKGRIVATGGPELALELERTGYEPYFAALGPADSDDESNAKPAPDNPFADIPF